ncbi:hypothetical protein TNCV_3270091 [Trichonephila clavipes]|uniref:Uncharacterized protein n=1 Tax=Trichonephila clavipes TaxID=2585209 RepID=A0A8X6V536_TRICX|nr:hypothetical protein TNCV_3270091 [Trichonephila clavipes]
MHAYADFSIQKTYRHQPGSNPRPYLLRDSNPGPTKQQSVSLATIPNGERKEIVYQLNAQNRIELSHYTPNFVI